MDLQNCILGLYWLAGRTVAFPKCPHLDPWNPWICYVMWEKRIKAADGIKFAHQLTWRQGGYLELDLNQPSVTTRALESGKERQKDQCQSGVMWETNQPFLTLNMKGTWATECMAPLEAEKSRKQALSWNLQVECSPFGTLILAQWDSHQTFDLQSCKIINVLFQANKFVVICYTSTKKLTQITNIFVENREPSWWRKMKYT